VDDVAATPIRDGGRPLQSTIEELRADVVELLAESCDLLARAGAAFDDPTPYAARRDQLSGEIDKVRSLELRVAIVAPMKAGKSTILNALLGEDLLPSRNTAMTAFPTSVVHAPDLDAPELHVGAMRQVLIEIGAAVCDAVRRGGVDSARQRAVGSPDLAPVIEAAARGLLPWPPALAVGAEAVSQALHRMNDVVRLWCALDPSAELLARLDAAALPELCGRLQIRSMPTGRLVVVDTPGPNDPALPAPLRDRVQRELESASLVLLVLDYTALNNLAADELRHGVLPILEVRGDRSLFVLVNKVDQRDPAKDLDSAGVLQFVAAQLGLKQAADRPRVFEVSARRALYASRLLRTFDDDDERCRALPAAVQLAREAYGSDGWEEVLAAASPDRLRATAERTWKRSGFDAFIDGALDLLAAEVAPRALTSALDVSRGLLRRLGDDLRIQRAAVSKEMGGLSREIEALRADIQAIPAVCQRIKQSFADSIADLEQFVAEVADRLRENARLAVQGYFREPGNLDAVITWLTSRRRLPITSSLCFESRDDALEFVDAAVALASAELAERIAGAEGQVARRTEEVRAGLAAGLERELRPILERTRIQLRSFDVDVEMPDLAAPTVELATSSRVVRPVAGGAERLTRFERRWYTLGLYRHRVLYEVPRPDRFQVSLDDVGQALGDAFERSLLGLVGGFKQFLDEELARDLDAFLADIEGRLTSYLNSIEHAAAHRERTLQEKDQAARTIRAIAADLDRLLRAQASTRSLFGGQGAR
jgi:hypothetical protein